MEENNLNNENLTNDNSNQVEQDEYQSPYSPQELAQAEKLCIYSICFVATAFIADILIFLFCNTGANALFVVFEVVKLVGLILMIVCRAKYPKHVFAKVLMWVYIALYVMQFIYLFYWVMLIITCLNSCNNFY